MVRLLVDKSYKFVTDLIISLLTTFFVFGGSTIVGLLVIGNPFQVQLQTILFVASLLALPTGVLSFVCLVTGRFLPVRKFLTDHLLRYMS